MSQETTNVTDALMKAIQNTNSDWLHPPLQELHDAVGLELVHSS